MVGSRGLSIFLKQTGLLLRNLNSVTRIQKPYYLLYIQNMVTLTMFLNSKPADGASVTEVLSLVGLFRLRIAAWVTAKIMVPSRVPSILGAVLYQDPKREHNFDNRPNACPNLKVEISERRD